jgi:hypothetical protein
LLILLLRAEHVGVRGVSSLMGPRLMRDDDDDDDDDDDGGR